MTLKEFCEKNRNNVELVEVYENCYGEDKTIWMHYKLEEGIPVIIDRGEGEDDIPEAQFRVFGDYQNYVDVCEGRLDPNKVGGTAFIGISRPVIKAHGGSNAEAIENAVGQAIQVAQSGITEAIAEHIDKMQLPTA